ncbi:MAG: O-acetylhomoserine aminocarboxypropyltransferase [Sulfurimonas sp. RIFOXYD12_FULL_33_39]|uniref:O-acetylhomoserine aminocarboxypropyltransferase/cysteine synthase family protein n=1 Tax=unclassified Sulfurimonas TaxID=2623549 RepID=UPI0008B9B947|nr:MULTISPECIES: O-acetylhomoserine aminocarboxypropyltransferase/cysteine synthase family protein [unclassified Sulfurimonas]OHE08953.1 MAG: O-acetylhomoserine aminocarboxypropyltransferase [Sulfurimonas sp. RIFOXYD12_FULL_33_39]OHE14263.1 MAG: O-acetylhomoserine aminocarboxypropyltransferase [Sulfurimonas sp. RIFOXYD2_FULL_34_21]DAB28884.1 MAG TPA: O-acetylhomoserine aminocarboxypropyltransferase [Sulfurimonas sp. UBA10385]
MDLQTKALHVGYDKDSSGAMAVPIYQTTAYEFRDAQHAANLFALKELGFIYTRLNNPTTDVFEKRFASLEGGAAAIATSSGMSAIFYAIANAAAAGDNILCAKQLYGGSLTLNTHTLKRFGIEARYFDVHDMNALESLIDDKTKVIFFESLTNPSIDVADIEAITKIANKHGILTVVDNTVATPAICRPFEFGADVTVHSASKYTTGQGLAIGGILVERNDLVEKLRANPRYAHFNEPDVSYHGLVYVDVPLPPFTLRTRLSLLRDLGAVVSPFNSWLFIQGIETLSLRMREHSKNALALAEFLESHPSVKKVNYPGLKSNINYKNAQKYFEDGLCSGLLSFEVGSLEEAVKIVNATKIYSLVVNIGDSKSIITHPASTTHQQLNEDELKACGVPSGLIRISCGLESAKDLIEDMKQALES